MNTSEITAKRLSEEFGKEVPDVFIVVAKHEVAGFDHGAIATILSCESHELREVLEDAFYKEVKGRIAAITAEETLAQSTGWDSLENKAISGLLKRIEFEKDPEFLLKVAAVANRATRKVSQNQSNVLDPGLRAGRATITLTQRLVEKINGKGERTTEETRQLSIKDGSMVNPSFGEIDELLSVKQTAIIPKMAGVMTHDVTATELLDSFIEDH